MVLAWCPFWTGTNPAPPVQTQQQRWDFLFKTVLKAPMSTAKWAVSFMFLRSSTLTWATLNRAGCKGITFCCSLFLSHSIKAREIVRWAQCHLEKNKILFIIYSELYFSLLASFVFNLLKGSGFCSWNFCTKILGKRLHCSALWITEYILVHH